MPLIVARKLLKKSLLYSLIFLSLLVINGCAIFGPNRIDGIEMKLSNFKSDGCSSFPDGRLSTKKNEWLHCCFVHDMSYWIGGVKLEREAADKELKQCVTQVTSRTQGEAMQLGVEIGGGPQTGLTWRWAYGWNIEAPYFIREKRHYIEIKEKFKSIAVEVNRWDKEFSIQQRKYIKEKLLNFKTYLNI